MNEDVNLKYKVGALLYTPALNTKISNDLKLEKFGKRFSLALCLEDTISDASVEFAEETLCTSLHDIYSEYEKYDFYLPKIFIRVRSASQMERIYECNKDVREIITGFVLPKYSINNADEYNQAIVNINNRSNKKIYIMPILESLDIVDYFDRRETLKKIKEKIDSVNNYVLNVRVGGNDFSNDFAVRRHIDETIYDILPVAQLLTDIITVFSREYVLSGPVWEFFSSENDEWKVGLQKELKLDLLNGFIGKTVIHPKQIDVINNALMVSKEDYEDATKILGWEDNDFKVAVAKSYDGKRMNEVKTHINWAKKIIMLAKIYGVEGEENKEITFNEAI